MMKNIEIEKVDTSLMSKFGCSTNCIPIKDDYDLLIFAKYCTELLGFSFHWDNNFNSYVDKNGKKCFNDNRIELLNDRLNECLKLDSILFEEIVICLINNKLRGKNDETN
jgi:hypothetical protein